MEYTPADQKSLYRRATAFERLGKLNEAISDAQRLITISSDEQTNILLRRLRENAQNKHAQQSQLTTQIEQMFETINSKSNAETVCIKKLNFY